MATTQKAIAITRVAAFCFICGAPRRMHDVRNESACLSCETPFHEQPSKPTEVALARQSVDVQRFWGYKPPKLRHYFMLELNGLPYGGVWATTRSRAELMAAKLGLPCHVVRAWPFHERGFEELPDITVGYDKTNHLKRFQTREILEWQGGRVMPTERGRQLLKS